MRKLIKDLYNQAFKEGSYERYNLKGYIKHFAWYWQRIVKGYDDSETYSFFYDHTEWVLPRLKRFQELKFGYPPSLSEEEWDDIIDRMIVAFELIIEEDMDFDPYEETRFENRRKQIEEGLMLFAKWHRHLWW